MPRADFYLIAKPRFREEPLRLACELVRKAYDANLPLLVLARDTAQAELLDDLLWDMGEDAYIPHQIAGRDDEDDITPVLIVEPQTDVPMRPLVLNLRDAPLQGGFERRGHGGRRRRIFVERVDRRGGWLVTECVESRLGVGDGAEVLDLLLLEFGTLRLGE